MRQTLPARRNLGFQLIFWVIAIGAIISAILATIGAIRPAHAESPMVVASINAKLARFVHRTGKCIGAEEQLATYYWSGTHVACGGRFNPDGLTAASRTLPCGTKLTVRNPHNGREVRVTITDRGPFTIAKLDLARGAARAIGMVTSIYVCVRRE